MNPRSTDYEADALTTTPLRRLVCFLNIFNCNRPFSPLFPHICCKFIEKFKLPVSRTDKLKCIEEKLFMLGIAM